MWPTTEERSRTEGTGRSNIALAAGRLAVPLMAEQPVGGFRRFGSGREHSLLVVLEDFELVSDVLRVVGARPDQVGESTNGRSGKRTIDGTAPSGRTAADQEGRQQTEGGDARSRYAVIDPGLIARSSRLRRSSIRANSPAISRWKCAVST